MGRAPCCSMVVGLERGPWTAKEDALLIDYVKRHGEGHWSNVPKNAGLQRCGKSCRLRWMNYLRPDIKRGNFSPDEDDLIIRLHKLLGNRWSLIARRLQGRSDNEIKNYWNSHLSKRLLLQRAGTKTDQPKASTDSKKKKNVKTHPENANQKETTNTNTSLQRPTRVFPFLSPITRNESLDSMPSGSSHGEGKITRAANDIAALNSLTPPWSDPVVAGGDGELNLFDHNVFDISSLDDLIPTEEYHNMFNKTYAEYQELLMSSENHIVELDYALVDSFFV